MTTYTLPYMAKINISPIYWTGMLSYIGILVNYSDILNQNLSISKIAIYHPRRPSWTTKKVHISELSRQIFTNLPRMCEKKNCK